MGDIIDLDKIKSRKNIQKAAAEKGMVYEIYLSVVRYIKKQMEFENGFSIEYLTTEVELEKVFNGETNKLASCFADLIKYWEIELEDGQLGLCNFATFKTVGDLCSFIERSVNQNLG